MSQVLPISVEPAIILFPIPPAATLSDSSATGYQVVRFNAVKHAILSRSAVLPHEDAAEFSDLLATLVDSVLTMGSTLFRERFATKFRETQRTINSGIDQLCPASYINPTDYPSVS
jgi:hypothetical protein